MDDRQGISALVNCLRVPTTQMRVSSAVLLPSLSGRADLLGLSQEVLLDMLFDIFRIKTPPWYLAFLDGKRLTRTSASQLAIASS